MTTMKLVGMVAVFAGLVSAGCTTSDEVPTTTKPQCNVDARCTATCEYGEDKARIQGQRVTGMDSPWYSCAYSAGASESTREYALRVNSYPCEGSTYTVQPWMLGMDKGILCTGMSLSTEVKVTLEPARSSQ